NFLTQKNARYGGYWNILGTACDAWVVPTDTPPTYGTWFSLRQDNGNPWRIVNIDADNPCRIPVLGAYYLANLSSFALTPATALRTLVATIKSGKPGQTVRYTNPLVTQRDIQAASAAPLAYAPCTIEQIQGLIPGLSPTSNADLPRWTDQTYIEGWTIGIDF